MNAAAARMIVASPARRLMRPVSASTVAKAMTSAKAVSGATWLVEQSAFERRAQSRASGCGFGFGGRKRESVGPERIGAADPPSWLAWRLGDQRESVQPIGEFRRQKVVDETMPLNSATTFELGGHHPDAIMRAPAFARARMSRVKMGLVDDVEKNGIERRQTRDNSLLHDHGLSTPVKQIATLNILRWAGR